MLLAIALAAGAARLPPVDQCAGDPSFARFRADLIRTIERKDRKALLDLLADDVLVDFDGSAGRREFARAWNLDRSGAAKSAVWRELRTVMRLGCARIDRARVAPSLVGQLSDADQFEKFIAMPGAKLRQTPSDRGRVIATLNFHLVTFREGDAPNGWLRVATSDGRRGYLRRDQMRGALEYRAQFEKARGRWRMTSFVQGD